MFAGNPDMDGMIRTLAVEIAAAQVRKDAITAQAQAEYDRDFGNSFTSLKVTPADLADLAELQRNREDGSNPTPGSFFGLLQLKVYLISLLQVFVNPAQRLNAFMQTYRPPMMWKRQVKANECGCCWWRVALRSSLSSDPASCVICVVCVLCVVCRVSCVSCVSCVVCHVSTRHTCTYAI